MWFAIRGAFLQHWRHTARPGEFLFNAFNQAATVAVVAWLASTGASSAVVAAVAVGVVFLVLWRAAIFQLGFLVVDAHNQGTLESEITSQAPVAALMLGKTLAAATFYGAIGVAGAGLTILIAGPALEVGHGWAVVLGVPVATLAVVAVAFLFGPLTFVVGGKPGFFNAIIPIGIVLSGFVHPIGLLPAGVEVFARVLPTAWAMESLQLALVGDAGMPRIVLGWSVSCLLAVAALALAWWLFGVAERRVRQVGLT